MNKLINGDCIVEMDKLIDDKTSIDYAFTSPPYNRKRNDKYSNYDDNIDDYYKFLCDCIDRLLIICKKGIFFNIQANFYNRIDVYKVIGRYAEHIQEIFIWEKTNPMPASGNSITNAVEYFLYLSKDRPKANFTYTKNIIHSSVNSDMTKEHKDVMKQDVSDWFIANFTQENDTILDCFMGLGTTAISCIKNNRNFIGIELNKEYFDIAMKIINSTNFEPKLF